MPIVLHLAATAILLAGANTAWALGEETQGLAFGVELGAHFGAGPNELSRTEPEIGFGELAPPIDEVALTLGSRVDALRSELALRVAYGFARGNADAGTGTVEYAVRRVPLTLAWRAILFDGRVRPLLGVDAGVIWTGARYRGAFAGEAGLDLGLTLRALAGIDLAVGDASHFRLFLQYRRDPGRTVVGGPDLRGDHLAMGLGYAITFDRPEPPATPTTGAPFRSAGTGSGLDEAFAWIRRGDERARRGDAIGAERAYSRGVELLPRDADTRENVELPVRLDWASQLVAVGRREDAIEVLEAAREIQPGNRRVLETLRALGALGAETDRPTEEVDDGRSPVVPNR